MRARYLNVGFTGTQSGMTEAQKKIFKAQLSELRYQAQIPGPTWFHHGDCIGADAEAHEIACYMGCSIYLHPPIDEKKEAFCDPIGYMARPKDYMMRNLDIVLASDYMFACPAQVEEQVRSGTWSTVRKARQHLRPLSIILPDGTIKLENWK